MHLAQLAQTALDEFGELIFLVVFVLFTLGGRLLRWLAEKAAGQTRPPADPVTRPVAREDDPGAELWRRLMEGEEPRASTGTEDEPTTAPEPASPAPMPPGAAPMPRPAPVPEFERVAAEVLPEPLPGLTPALPSIAAAEDRLESGLSELTPAELPSIRPAFEPLRAGPGGAPRPEPHERPGLPAGALRSAILWSEILSPPLALRGSRLPGDAGVA